jgi:hypothetical protein
MKNNEKESFASMFDNMTLQLTLNVDRNKIFKPRPSNYRLRMKRKACLYCRVERYVV